MRAVLRRLCRSLFAANDLTIGADMDIKVLFAQSFALAL
jgi:hypothetical protein